MKNVCGNLTTSAYKWNTDNLFQIIKVLDKLIKKKHRFTLHYHYRSTKRVLLLVTVFRPPSPLHLVRVLGVPIILA